ncbi:MAG: hypothetical protein CMI54_04210, partial [Parcubacteria group bacterium]|nr:hypothetical protein [Parcubacteria group bacterium]
MSLTKEDVIVVKQLIAKELKGVTSSTPVTVGTASSSSGLTSDDDLMVSGKIEADGLIFPNAGLTLDSTSADLNCYRFSSTPPGSIKNIVAGTGVTSADVAGRMTIKVAGSGGAVTVTAAPNVPDGANGQFLLLVGTHDTNTVTFQDKAQQADSGLNLAGGAD